MNAFRLAGDMTHLLSIIILLLKIRNMKSCAGISLKTQELYVLVFATRYLDLVTNYVSFYNTVMKLVFLGTSISIVWYMRYHKVVKQTYNKDEDTFRHLFLVLPCFVLALMIHRSFTVTETLFQQKWSADKALDFPAPSTPCLVQQRKARIFRYFLLYFVARGHSVFSSNPVGIAEPWKRKLNIQVLWSFSLYLEAVAILPQLVLLQRSRNIDNLTGNYVFLLGAYRALYLVNWVYRFFTEKHQVRWIPWISGLVQTALYADFFYYYIKSWKNHEKFRLPE